MAASKRDLSKLDQFSPTWHSIKAEAERLMEIEARACMARGMTETDTEFSRGRYSALKEVAGLASKKLVGIAD